MIRKLVIVIVVAGAIGGGWRPSLAIADGTVFVVSRTDQEKIDTLLRKDPAFIKECRDKKVVFSTAATYQRKPSGSEVEQEYARTLHYRYDDRKTIRTVLNIKTEKVEKLEILENYPTPLGPSELLKAQEIVFAKSTEAIALRTKFPGEPLAITALVASIPDKSDSRYGKRIVTLYLKPGHAKSTATSITVNLSDEVLSPP